MLDHSASLGLDIAVIDDEESVRVGLRAQLEPLGHTLHLFASGEDFLGSAKAQTFDLILLDIWFRQGMTGLELLRQLPQAGITAPVIMITAEPAYETAFDAAQLGVKAYLPKPIRRVPLLEALRKALDEGQPRLKQLSQINGLNQLEWEALLREAEAKLDPDVLGRLKDLTPTEAKVFRLLASEGLSNKEMARRLEKGEKVIEAHRAKIIQKLGTGNLIQLHSLLQRLLGA
jgi:DNA-binding NarL/FixJ family response regulator